jgi:hypothetical protein
LPTEGGLHGFLSDEPAAARLHSMLAMVRDGCR